MYSIDIPIAGRRWPTSRKLTRVGELAQDRQIIISLQSMKYYKYASDLAY